jgi:hypothetical protein
MREQFVRTERMRSTQRGRNWGKAQLYAQSRVDDRKADYDDPVGYDRMQDFVWKKRGDPSLGSTTYEYLVTRKVIDHEAMKSA